jgi:hypothetical protein
MLDDQRIIRPKIMVTEHGKTPEWSRNITELLCERLDVASPIGDEISTKQKQIRLQIPQDLASLGNRRCVGGRAGVKVGREGDAQRGQRMGRPREGQGAAIDAELLLPAKPIRNGRHPALA